ncbi:uncharacterized protein [Physcomitrium patens]|uniref:uncharacterized protein n=1 Tax=Physcomitrium patens TaxID=3218 RepID=UPI003CCDD8C2
MAGTGKDDGEGGVFGGPGGLHLLDTTGADKSVWLLKVPPLVGHQWLKQQDGAPVLAKVTMSMDPLNPNSDSVEFMMTLPEKDLVAPHKSYNLNVTKDLVPMHIFSETTQGKLKVEGKVEHKFDMKPSNIGNNDEYRKLCRDRLNKSMVKTRTTQVLSNDRGGFMRPPPIDAWPTSTFTGKVRVPVAGVVEWGIRAGLGLVRWCAQFMMTLPEKDLVAPHKSYNLNVTKDLVPMHIFSETTQGKLKVEGKVEHKFDMKPSNIGNNDEYRKLCRDRLNKSMVKTRTTQVLSNDRGGFMRPPPIDAWPTSTFTGKDSKKKAPISSAVKAPEGKRIRRDRVELEAIVFKLFEQRPNWALKHLVEETDQPVAFLKEILNDLCIYNKRGANQGTYELKPEYKRTEKEEDVKPAV